MNLAATIGLNSAPFQAGVASAIGSIGRFASAVANPMAIAAGAIAGVAAAVTAVGVGIKKAANMEDLETSFVTLLGSSEAAKKRLEELSKFAANTPFDLPGIGKASKILQSLTGDSLSTGKGLEMVGDMAAMAGVPIEDLSVTVGRLYSGLMSGKASGEAIARLSELGLMSAETRTKLEKLQSSGKKGAEVWNVAAKDFAKYAGEMDRKSKTWNGMLSTLADNISMAFAKFGEPIMDVLKPYLGSCISLTDKLSESAAAFGETIAMGISLFSEAWANGDLGELIILALKAAFFTGVNYFVGMCQTAISAIGVFLQEILKAAFTSEFWVSVANLALGAFAALGAFLLDIFKAPIAYLRAGLATCRQEMAEFLASMSPKIADYLGIDKNYKAKTFDENLKDAKAFGESETKGLVDISGKTLSSGGKDMANVLKPMGDALLNTLSEFKPSDLTDAASAQKELVSKIEPIKKIIEDKKRDADIAISKETAAKNSENQKDAASGTKLFTEGDSLAKIGGYVGLKGGSTYNYAKRTADATEKLVKETRRTNEILSRQNATNSSSDPLFCGA